MPLIVEGLCTTLNVDGSVNIAPMGPIVDPELSTFLFRPFRTSTTFANLSRTGQGVFHITDDVELIARAAVGALDPPPPTVSARDVVGAVLTGACRAYEFEVVSIDASQDRTEMTTRTLRVHRFRDFFGLNRAMSGIIELAVSATRLGRLADEQVLSQLEYWRTVIAKTGGPGEFAAFEFLEGHILRQLPAHSGAADSRNRG